MDVRSAITYLGFRNFPDTHRNSPIVTPTLPVVNGSALHQQVTYPPDADAISFSQQMYPLALLSRPQNFFKTSLCPGLDPQPASSLADFHPTAAGFAVIPLRPDRQISSFSLWDG